MITGITGIKNEVKRTRRSFDSPLGSALTKNLKKVLGHPIFFDFCEILKNAAFNGIESNFDLSIILIQTFLSVQVHMLWFCSVIFGAPIWCP